MTPKTHTHSHSHEEKLISDPGKSKYLEQLAQAAEKVDPTRTKTLRRDYMAAAYKRFRNLKGLIRKAVVDLDIFELGQGPSKKLQELPDKGDFKFTSRAEKVDLFDTWLDERFKEGILEPPDEFPDRWQKEYVRRSYNSGVKQAQRKMRQAGMDVPRLGRAEFRNIFNQPIHKDKLELLYKRNYKALKGITDETGKQISETLTRGLSQGWNPRKMATALNNRVDKIGITRARTMARTETIYTHNEAALTRYEQIGVEEVAAEVEWITAGDLRVCPDCAGLEGTKYTLEEAHGLLPYHANCRCTWVPATF